MNPLLLSIILILFFSWLQYLYVRQPGRFYLWSSGVLIGVMIISFLGLWTNWTLALTIIIISLGVQWGYYWLFFIRFPDKHHDGRKNSLRSNTRSRPD